MLSNEEKQAIRDIKNEYQRKWRKQNPDKVQANTERFWLRKLQQIERKLENETTEKNNRWVC